MSAYLFVAISICSANYRNDIAIDLSIIRRSVLQKMKHSRADALLRSRYHGPGAFSGIESRSVNLSLIEFNRIDRIHASSFELIELN